MLILMREGVGLHFLMMMLLVHGIDTLAMRYLLNPLRISCLFLYLIFLYFLDGLSAHCFLNLSDDEIIIISSNFS